MPRRNALSRWNARPKSVFANGRPLTGSVKLVKHERVIWKTSCYEGDCPADSLHAPPPAYTRTALGTFSAPSAVRLRLRSREVYFSPYPPSCVPGVEGGWDSYAYLHHDILLETANQPTSELGPLFNGLVREQVVTYNQCFSMTYYKVHRRQIAVSWLTFE